MNKFEQQTTTFTISILLSYIQPFYSIIIHIISKVNIHHTILTSHYIIVILFIIRIILLLLNTASVGTVFGAIAHATVGAVGLTLFLWFFVNWVNFLIFGGVEVIYSSSSTVIRLPIIAYLVHYATATSLVFHIHIEFALLLGFLLTFPLHTACSNQLFQLSGRQTCQCFFVCFQIFGNAGKLINANNTFRGIVLQYFLHRNYSQIL